MRRSADEIAIAQSAGRKFANPLCRVAEKWDFPLLANRQRLAPGLQHAGFVIRGHDGNQAWTGMRQLFCQPVQIHDAFPRDGNVPVTFGEVMLRGRHHARVFDGGEPDFRICRKRAREMVEHGVIRLRRAGSPDQV